MHVCYVILSPTFGIHQGTADLANLQVAPVKEDKTEPQTRVTVLTITGAPVDRYAPQVDVRPIVSVRGTGLQRTSFNFRTLWKVYRTILQVRPDVVHFNGPHIWNPILLLLLRRAGIPTIQTVHDLDPHSGSRYGRLLYFWNDLVIRLAKHVLVYAQVYRMRLIKRGLPSERVTCLPLLHLFLSYENERCLELDGQAVMKSARSAADRDPPFALFFARLEAYKGLDVLIEAMRRIEVGAPGAPGIRAVIAGKGDIHRFVTGPLPCNVEVRNRLIGDDEALELFSQCGLVVLPYADATQSALIAAAYFFGKPVIVTRVGALPEYVVEGRTGWVIEPGDVQALAECLQVALCDPGRLVHMGECGRAWYQAQRKIQHSALHTMYYRVSKAVKSPEV